jgi:pimeloyl-ACP methyl ester carboxylesterase
MATIDPARVEAMVVVSAPRRFPEQARAIQRGYSEQMLGEAELARMRVRHPREGQVAALVAQTRLMADHDDPDFSDAELARITAATLVVFGDRDPLYPVSTAFDLHTAIPGSHLWVVPNGGHGPIFGRHAPLFIETAFSALRIAD